MSRKSKRIVLSIAITAAGMALFAAALHGAMALGWWCITHRNHMPMYVLMGALALFVCGFVARAVYETLKIKEEVEG